MTIMLVMKTILHLLTNYITYFCYLQLVYWLNYWLNQPISFYSDKCTMKGYENPKLFLHEH